MGDLSFCTSLKRINEKKLRFLRKIYLSQGLMFGYATDETKERMPLSLLLAHKLLARLHELRRNGTLEWALPDSKSQVFSFFILHC